MVKIGLNGWELYGEYTDNYTVGILVYVMGSHADAYFPRESLEKTEGKYKTRHFAFDDLCHDMMLDEQGWKNAANVVLEFLNTPNELKEHPDEFIKYLEGKYKK